MNALKAPPALPDSFEMRFLNWSRLHVELVWVHDGPLAREHRDRSIEGQLAAAWLLRRGSVTLTFSGLSYHAAAGQWVFPPASDGWVRFSDDAELLSIRFVITWPDRTPLFAPEVCQIFSATGHPQLETTGRRLAQLARRTLGDRHTDMRDGRANLEHHFELQQFFYCWLREYAAAMQSRGILPHLTTGSDERLPRALAFMEQHAPGTVSEADIARHVRLSVSQLNRLFGRRIGMSPKALMDRRRIQQARQDLEYSQAPIKAIAYRLGFSSLPHFSRWFSKRLGTSPSQFRLAVTSASERR